jgi:2',3'-cyclic-nucleotide 2'-phosphodiesterase (5'-nucleotidase family)
MLKRARASIFIWLLAVVPLFAREVPITILHTCDLHGNVLPTSDYDGHTNLGGIARCATVIKQTRQQEKNVLLVDAGDTFQGAAVSFLSDGLVMVKVLNHLRYDAWVWGNHEFDWGLEKLAGCAERAEMPILNANVKLVSGRRTPHPDPLPANGERGQTFSRLAPTRVGERPGLQSFAGTGEGSAGSSAGRIAARLRPFIVREVDGVKVGIVGLNTPGIPSWSRPRLIAGLKFADSVETLREVLPELKAAGAQVNVLVCHQGYRDQGDDYANQVRAIAQNFPEFDAIIGGHTHRDFPEFKVSRVLYCQANYFGIHLGRVDLVYDTDKERVTQARSKTILMDAGVPVDMNLTSLCAEELDRAAKALGTVIGEAKADFGLRGAPQKETPIHNLIFESIAGALERQGVKVDAIVHGILDKKAALAKGPVTVADIWKVVPYENTIGVARLTPAELREILEENAGAHGSTMFRGIWGLHWTFDSDAEAGQRVVSLTGADGEPLPEGKRLAVAFNSYDLAGGGDRWKKVRQIVDRPESKLVEYDFQTREAVIEYVRSRGTIAPATFGWWKAEKKSQSSKSLMPSGEDGMTSSLPR